MDKKKNEIVHTKDSRDHMRIVHTKDSRDHMRIVHLYPDNSCSEYWVFECRQFQQIPNQFILTSYRRKRMHGYILLDNKLMTSSDRSFTVYETAGAAPFTKDEMINFIEKNASDPRLVVCLQPDFIEASTALSKFLAYLDDGEANRVTKVLTAAKRIKASNEK